MNAASEARSARRTPRKRKPFIPTTRMKRILERAANECISQMRSQSFADRRSEGIVLSAATEHPNNSFAF
jgi:hypothetical protein